MRQSRGRKGLAGAWVRAEVQPGAVCIVGALVMEGSSRTLNILELFKPFQIRQGLVGDEARDESEAHTQPFVIRAQPLHKQMIGGRCEHGLGPVNSFLGPWYVHP